MRVLAGLIGRQAPIKLKFQDALLQALLLHIVAEHQVTEPLYLNVDALAACRPISAGESMNLHPDPSVPPSASC